MELQGSARTDPPWPLFAGTYGPLTHFTSTHKSRCRGRKRGEAATQQDPQAGPGSGQQGTGHARKPGLTVLRQRNETPAGSTAGAMAAILRGESRMLLHFTSVLGILKAMKVLALANSFLNQHQNAVSFAFKHSASPRDQAKHHQQHQEQVQNPAAASSAGNHLPEPVPSLPPMLFELLVWQRQMQTPELDMRLGSKVEVLDFSLDVRKEWRKVAYVSLDTALSIADHLYSKLMDRLLTEQELAAAAAAPPAPSSPAPAPAPDMAAEGAEQAASPAPAAAAAASSMSASSQPAASAAATEQGQAHASAEYPRMVTAPVIASTDLSQAVLVFTALAFIQQRLTAEGDKHMLVASVFRCTAVPRLDGRNGFLIKLHLAEKSEIDAHFKKGMRSKQPPPQPKSPRGSKGKGGKQQSSSNGKGGQAAGRGQGKRQEAPKAGKA